MELSTKLRQLREGKRMSQLEVALIIGVGQSAYNTWENGVTPKAKYFPLLADLYGIDVTELFPKNAKVEVQTEGSKETFLSVSAKDLYNDLLSSLKDLNTAKDEIIKSLKEEISNLKLRIKE
jgi:transcriptional regulator with XRE-family HTH domain